jgi:ATP-dependent 26S proteasome regulatory subunit
MTEKKLEQYIRAMYPIVVITSHEEERVMRSVLAVASRRDPQRTVVCWSITGGFNRGDWGDTDTSEPMSAFDVLLAPYREQQEDDNMPFAQTASDKVGDYGIETYNFKDENGVDVVKEKPVMFVFKDMHNLLVSNGAPNPVLTRYLREIALEFEKRKHTLILLSPSFTVPVDLEKTVAVIDWGLPDNAELETILTRCEKSMPNKVLVDINHCRQDIVQALRGLTEFEAGSVLLSSIAGCGEMTEKIIPLIINEKEQIVKKSGVLEYIPDFADMTKDVGGLKHLKTHAFLQRQAFTKEAQEFGVEKPKGLMLVGIPGVGKSLMAKAIAGGKMPLLRMDVGALMGSLVGQSEGNMRQALKTAEAVAPCVLWIDEVEKALGGTGGERDGGTSMRVLGTLLTWMQEKSEGVYVVATANDVRSLRPELLRRFDDIIYAGLPCVEDRLEIFNVHLKKRGRSLNPDHVLKAAQVSRGYTGAEIEKVVKMAIKVAFSQGKSAGEEDLVTAVERVVPISRTMAEDIAELREWAQGRAIMANDPLEAPKIVQSSDKKTVQFEIN